MGHKDSYLNENGDVVFTSDYYLRKGSCCKSCCLHCPYGMTLKKFGLEFEDYSVEKKELAQKILMESGRAEFDLKNYANEFIKFATIKGVICGLICVDKLFVKEIFLKHHFQNQGLDKEVVESYFFY